MSYKAHAIVEIDSAKRTRGTIGQFYFELTTGILFSSKGIEREYFIRFEDIKIPTSYYNINSTNNVLKINEFNGVTNTIITATVPTGNYLITELLLELTTQLNAATTQTNVYTLDKVDTTGKTTFYFTGGGTTITIKNSSNGSTLNAVLGLDTVSEPVINDGSLYTSPYHMNLARTRYLKITCDVGSNNLYTKEGHEAAGITMPITVNRSSVQEHENHDGYYIKINPTNDLKGINFLVRDNFGNVVDFNGVDWSMVMVFYEYRK